MPDMSTSSSGVAKVYRAISHIENAERYRILARYLLGGERAQGNHAGADPGFAGYC